MTCTSCGASMPPESRFCPECGAPTFPPPGGPVPAGGAPPVPEAPADGRGIPTVVKVGVPLVVLGVAVALVVAYLRGSDGGTGAGSPDGAVQALADSLADDDLLGALSIMAPDEVGPLSEVVETALARAGELGLVEVTEEGLAALDVQVGELDLEVEEVHPEVAKVTITRGALAADVSSRDLGLALVTDDGVRLLDAGAIEGSRDLTEVGPDAGVDETFVMTVRRGGEWYVSPLYTLAEMLRESEGAGGADFDASREGVEGAATPVEAVEEAVRAIEAFDLEAGAAVLPPRELGIARDYLQALLGEIDREELEADRDDLDLRIDGLSLRDAGDLGGGRRRVVIERFDYSFDDDGDTVEGRFEGRCVEEDGEEPECLDDALASNRLDPVLAELLPDELFVVAVEEAGGWYVSPVETLAAYLRDVVEQVDERHLTAMGLVEPVALDLGASHDGELASPYERHTFTFEVEEGTPYLATVEGDGDLPMEAAVHPVGAEVWEGGVRAYDEEALRPGAFIAAGTRYAMAVAVDLDRLPEDEDPGDDPVAYEVHVRELEVEDELELDEPVEIELEAGEVVAYEFTPPDDADVVGVVEGEVRVDLLDPDGRRTTVEDGVPEPFYVEGPHLVIVTAREEGEARVGFESAEPDGPATSDELLIEPPETIETIDEIALGEVKRLTFAEGDIYDFVFTGTGEELVVVAAGADAVFDPVLVIFDEDLEVVAQNEGDAVERRAEEVLETEEGAIYVVSVAGFQGMAGEARVVVRPAE